MDFSVSFSQNPFLCASVSVSLSVSVSMSLWPALISQHPYRGPGEQSCGGRGQWEQDSVRFSPRTIRAGKGWSQGLAQTSPPACLGAPRSRPVPLVCPKCQALFMLVPVLGREANLAYLPQTRCPDAFLEGGITFDSKEHVRSGARSLRPDYTDSAHVLFTPVSGVGGGCLRVSLPRVSELEETSGSLCPPGGCPSLP